MKSSIPTFRPLDFERGLAVRGLPSFCVSFARPRSLVKYEGGLDCLGETECGLFVRGEEKVRIGRGRGVTCIEGPESELEVDMTEAFLLREARDEVDAASRVDGEVSTLIIQY